MKLKNKKRVFVYKKVRENERDLAGFHKTNPPPPLFSHPVTPGDTPVTPFTQTRNVSVNHLRRTRPCW